MSGRKRKAVPDGATGLLFRALLQNEPPEWAQMPFITRACALQIMRRIDANNEIVCAPGKTPYDAVYLAFGVQPNERRRVKEAIDELARNRWVTLTEDRLRAHFPDLGASRPSQSGPQADSNLDQSGFQSDSGASTVAPKSATSQEPGTEIQNQDAPTVEKRRGEEKKVEEREEERALDPMLWRAVDIGLRSEFKKHGIVFSDLTGASWGKVVYWAIDHAEACREPTSVVAAKVALGFHANQKAKLHGYPLSYLVTNSRQFYEEGQRANMTPDTYEDEEMPL